MSSDSFSTDEETAELRRIVAEYESLQVQVNMLEARQAETLAAAMRLATSQIERMASPGSREHEMPVRAAAAELATAVRMSDRTIQTRMNDAASLVARFPATVAMWKEGRVSRGHVGVIADAGDPIDDDSARAAFERSAVRQAVATTPGRLKSAVAYLAEDYRTVTITARHVAARARRRVGVTEVDDGMSELWMLTPTVIAHGIFDRMTQGALDIIAGREMVEAHSADGVLDLAGSEPDATCGDASCSGEAPGHESCRARTPATSDTRTLDQVRVDLIADLLLTGTPTLDTPTGLAAIHATVEVTVPALTLLGRDDQGASLTGRSPIDADTARTLAGGCTGWNRVMTHPVSGAVLAVDRYTPSADLRRFLRARDEHCRFPGCRIPARRCDVDHTHDAALGGATCAGNTAHLCRRHHTLKHHGGWSVRQRAGGVLEWTSPTGRTYADRPPAMVRFEPPPQYISEPPPF